jgi:predicted O-methyltransferase YrrM
LEGYPIQMFASIRQLILQRELRLYSPVQLHDFTLMGTTFYSDPNKLIDQIHDIPSNLLLQNGRIFPNYYDTNAGTLSLLELAIGKFRPSRVVETGTANGASARAILKAFEKFDLSNSELFSIDIDDRVATADLISNQQFHFVKIKSAKDFKNSLDSLGEIDLFYHDSDHSYTNQMFEYVNAWEILSEKNGCLISDDINWSNAFLDFCRRVNRIPQILADNGKFSGLIVKQ